MESGYGKNSMNRDNPQQSVLSKFLIKLNSHNTTHKNMGFVYKITCIATGKVYIGRTDRHYMERFNEHMSSVNYISGNCRLVAEAIREYGRVAFTCEPVFESDDSKLLDTKEIEFIKQFRSTNSEYGYNIAAGGKKSYDDIIKYSGVDATNMIESIDKRRTNPMLIGLPPYVNYNESKTGVKTYFINNHPLCPYGKCFSDYQYDSIEEAKEALIAFLQKLDNDGVVVKRMQQNGIYPTGLRPQKTGYIVRKMLDYSQNTWFFGGNKATMDQSLHKAIEFNEKVDEIIKNYKKSKKDECSETKCLSVIDVFRAIDALYKTYQ